MKRYYYAAFFFSGSAFWSALGEQYERAQIWALLAIVFAILWRGGKDC